MEWDTRGIETDIVDATASMSLSMKWIITLAHFITDIV